MPGAIWPRRDFLAKHDSGDNSRDGLVPQASSSRTTCLG